MHLLESPEASALPAQLRGSADAHTDGLADAVADDRATADDGSTDDRPSDNRAADSNADAVTHNADTDAATATAIGAATRDSPGPSSARRATCAC